MTTREKYFHDHIVWYDAAKCPGGTCRWLGVQGPKKVSWEELGQRLEIDDTTGDPTAYTTTVVEVGAGDSTVAVSDAAGGALVFTAAANEDDGIQIQSNAELFSFAAAYPFYMRIVWQAADVDQTDFLFGACITDTTLLGGMTDGIYFQSVDGTGAVTLEIEKDSSATSVAVGTMTDATDMTLELYWNGTAVSAWVDNVQVASAIAVTNLPDDELLAFSIAMLTGEAVANTLTVKEAVMYQIQQ